VIYLIAAAFVFVAIIIRALRRVQPMPPWMENADEEIRLQYQEWIVRPRALGDRLGDRAQAAGPTPKGAEP
jgi:hypothetical protein